MKDILKGNQDRLYHGIGRSKKPRKGHGDSINPAYFRVILVLIALFLTYFVFFRYPIPKEVKNVLIKQKNVNKVTATKESAQKKSDKNMPKAAYTRKEVKKSKKDKERNRIIRGKLRRNEFVFEVLLKNGVDPQTAELTLNALRNKFDFKNSRPGDEYIIEFNPEGVFLRFEFIPDIETRYIVTRKDKNTFIGKKVITPLDKEVKLITGSIKDSLYSALLALNENYTLINGFMEIFMYQIDFFREVRSGDRFTILVEKYYKDGKFIHYGHILAAFYDGRITGKLRAYRYNKGYYDEKGRSMRKAFLRAPLEFFRVSSRYGFRRHPILGYTKFHNGIDYAAPYGTKIYAAADGIVEFAGFKGPNGNLVVIRHPNGIETAYAHMKRIARGIRPGVRVKQKQVIGYVGSTGRSTGPHLHFGMKVNGHFVNPDKQLKRMPRGKPLRGQDLKKFKKIVKKYDGIITGRLGLSQAESAPN